MRASKSTTCGKCGLRRWKCKNGKCSYGEICKRESIDFACSLVFFPVPLFVNFLIVSVSFMSARKIFHTVSKAVVWEASIILFIYLFINHTVRKVN